MNPAVIVLTILGCDDSGVECHYVDTSQKRWANIETCSAASDIELAAYANAPYPVVIAVCQDPQRIETAEAIPPQSPSQTDNAQDVQEGLAAQAISRVRAVLPTTEGIRTLMQRPVRLVEESYSWVARKF
jgi:hypothetical protein